MREWRWEEDDPEMIGERDERDGMMVDDCEMVVDERMEMGRR